MNAKKITALLCGVSLAFALFAQEDFGDDFSFDDFGTGDASSGSPVEISGSVSGDVRGYVTSEDDIDNAGDIDIDGGANASLDIKYSGSNADAVVSLDLSSSTLKDYPEDVVKEAYVTGYFGNLKLDVGKMNVVWGKGDKIHVLDNFNADDYTDFIIPDYLYRRIATPMVRASYGFGYSNNVLSNMKFEAVYTPFLPVDRFAASGRWTPAQVTNLTNKVTDYATAKLASAFTNYTTASATVGTLSSLYAQSAAAQSAYNTASTTLSQINQVWAATGNETAYENYMKSLDSTYNSSYAADLAKIAAVEYDYKEAAGAYAAALQSSGYASVDEAKLALATYGTEYMYALSQASSLSSDSSILYPDTNTLKYGQAGARFTASLGPVDLGLSYYYGHYKQPSFNAEKFSTFLDKYLANESVTDDDKFLSYDQKQTFGLEAATILWHFNLRGEAAYNLTNDISGDDPWVHNNSVQWLGGFDIDLPFWNMNLNVQEYGTYVLNNDKITGSTWETSDVDYNVNGYSNNKLVANITTSFANDKVAPEVTVVYGFENGDLAVLPKLTVKPVSDISLIASGMYIWTRDDNSEFAAWNKNNFVQLGATVSF